MGTNITGIGNANAIGFKSRVTGGAYFPPELKDALVGVWSAYGKSNDSTDRNIIKNKIKDKGGDFELLNFNYKEGSGYGKYGTDFLNWNVETSSVTASSNKIEVIKESNMYKMYRYSSMTKNLPSFKVKISNLQKGYIRYYYRKQTGIEAYIDFHQNGIYELPASYKVDEGGTGTNGGFNSNAAVLNVGVTIEQIPEFKGAVVTDGIDDLIISTKTATEMGITNEVTVVSMIHQIGGINSSAVNYGYTNYFRGINHSTLRNNATGLNKTGIYGYSATNYTPTIINNILGDKNDYTTNSAGFSQSTYNNVFSVEGYKVSSMIAETSQVAWYWTFIANKVLTEDEINLVIEKYNLDRPGEIVTPQVYYNIKKQKISNDNHSAFDDKLIDYSGNGYDAKLYNFGWKEDSGIGKYETDFTDWKKSFKVTSFDSESIKFTSDVSWVLLYHPSSIGEDIPSFKVRIKLYGKGTLYYNYITQEGKYTNVAVKSEIFETPICYNTKYTGEKGVNVGFTLGVISGECSGTITQIPEYENALVLDGVDDYGKVTGLPILKDYTFLVDRQIINIGDVQRIVASKSESATDTAKQGAFLFEYLSKNSISTWSYYENNPLVANADFNRDISYQSKYIYNGKELTIGGAGDSDKLWLGTIRDNDSRFFNGAIYLLMLFPYSMSEFLIERQIEKVKGGTLYPNQVEFRPIIPEDENITKIDYFVVNSGTWTVIKPGDYVDVGARIVLNVYTKLPYKIAGASSTAFTGMTVGPSTALNIWDVKGYIKDKTPQKIKLTLAVNEDIVQWNPTISANIPDSYDAVTEWFANGWETKIAVGDWIKKSDRIFFKLKLKEPLHEIGKVTFGGSECQATKASNWSESNNLWEIVTYSSVGDLSQVFNVQVDEYIRYEDIVQPYPILLRFNDENGNGVSWGGKFRVGSTITRIGSIADPESNLLNGLYSISGLSLNGKAVTSSTSIVEKQMVFKTTATYLFDNNEPKCILSPRLLRIPNSSYKILRHIPDISGHGNHGVFNNFAFSKMSGADGYPYDYKSTSDFVAHAINAVLVNSETVKFINVLTQTSFYYKGTSYKGKIKVTGITKAIASGKVRYLDIYSNSPTNNDRVIIDKDGIYDVNIETEDAINIFFYLTPIVSGTTALDEPVYLEQVGNYEGSICFDGVDDYMDIPSLSIGGKQVLMKTNWLKSPTLLYDQRASGSFAILTTKEDDATNPRIAYQARNQDGKTYIDGIENNYIETYSLKGITHNITVTNPSAGSGVVPVIGANTGKSSGFAKMALYDFMLFDEVSTNEEIKQLNDIVGIEGNYVQRPPYYWDTHGKSNLDGDRGTIPQLGTAEDYSFTSFDNEIDWYLSSSNYIDVVSRNGYKITLKNLSTGIDGWRFQNSTVKRFILNDIPFKIKSNKTIRVYWDMHYNAISSTELRQKVVSVTTINPNEDTLINLRHLTEEELTELNVNKSTMYYLLWFDVSTLAVNEEVTIEMLPVEGGRNLWLNNYGFAYDKMSGYEGYSFKSFNDSQSWNIRGDSTGVEIISRNGYSMTVKKLVQNLDWQISNNEYRYPTILDKEVPFKCKSNKNVGLIWQLKYKTEGATSDTTVTLINQQLTPNVPLEISLPYKTQDELTELGAVSTSVYYLLYFSNTLLEIGEEYTVEMLPLYPNGLVYDGVDDYSENTSIPAFTDYTYIIKYEDFNNPNTGSCIQRKGSIKAGGGAFVQDHIYRGTKYQYNFGISSNIHKDDSIAFCTRTNYNGTAIPSGNNTDDTGFTIGKFDGYRKMVFYKEMLYPRTVNMLTINMIKNMMAEDGIIDIQGKLFTDKFTGDFNLDFNKDFLIGN